MSAGRASSAAPGSATRSRDKRIVVVVAGSRAGEDVIRAATSATPKVATKGTVTVSGTPRVGNTLTARPSGWAISVIVRAKKPEYATVSARSAGFTLR